jgi:hypothetical protein
VATYQHVLPGMQRIHISARDAKRCTARVP